MEYSSFIGIRIETTKCPFVFTYFDEMDAPIVDFDPFDTEKVLRFLSKADSFEEIVELLGLDEMDLFYAYLDTLEDECDENDDEEEITPETVFELISKDDVLKVIFEFGSDDRFDDIDDCEDMICGDSVEYDLCSMRAEKKKFTRNADFL